MLHILKFPILLLFTIVLLLLKQGYSQSPYYHQVYSASSTDGLTWTKQNVLLFDHASVPGSVIDTNGTVFLYFDYFATTTSNEQLKVATSTDGITFSSAQDVQITGSTVTRRVDPTVMRLTDGSIRLFYLDFDASPNTKDIHSARSTDGINFTEDAGIRFSKTPITDPDVFSIGDTAWAMYVSYWGNGGELVRAKSKDGLTFTEDTNFSFTQGAVCATMQFDSIFRTYYCGNGIVSFTTQDGKNITTESGVRIDGPVCDPTVLQMPDKTYMMYYKYITTAGIEENAEEKNTLSIYPNPIYDYATLVVRDPIYTHGALLNIYDVLGNKQYALNINQSHTLLDRKNLSSGIYFYSITQNNQPTLSGKIIIE